MRETYKRFVCGNPYQFDFTVRWIPIFLVLLGWGIYLNAQIAVNIIQPTSENEVFGCQDNIFTMQVENNGADTCLFNIHLTMLLGTHPLNYFEFKPTGPGWNEATDWAYGMESGDTVWNEIVITPDTIFPGDSLTLQYSLYFNCSDIVSAVDIGGSSLGNLPQLLQKITIENTGETGCSYTINNEASMPDTVRSAFLIPWLMAGSNATPVTLTLNSIRTFEFPYANTQGTGFNGALKITLPPYSCDIPILEVAVIVPGIDTLSISQTEGLDLSDGWMIENAIIPQGAFKIAVKVQRNQLCLDGCGVPFLKLEWGCDTSDICYTVPSGNHLQVIQDDPAAKLAISRISPEPDSTKHPYVWEGQCHDVGNNELLWEFVVENVFSGTIVNTEIKLTNLFYTKALTVIPASSINYNYSRTKTSNSFTFPDTLAHSLFHLDADSMEQTLLDTMPDFQVCLEDYSDSTYFIKSATLTLDTLRGYEKFFFSFKTVRCCAHNNDLSHEGVIYNRWKLTGIGYQVCSPGTPAYALDDSGEKIFEESGDTINGYPFWVREMPFGTQNHLAQFGYFSLHMDNGHKDNPSEPDLMLKQVFEQETTDLLGADTPSCGDPVDFFIQNDIFSTGVDGQLYTSSAFGSPEGEFIIQFSFDNASLILDTVTMTDFSTTWGSEFVNDTAVRFKISELPGINSLAGFQEFMNNSLIRFILRACCPSGNVEPIITVTTSFNPKMATCGSCYIPLSAISFPLKISCPGCVTPGMSIKHFTLERLNLGYEDVNNDRLPESDTISPPSLRPITSEYSRWDFLKRKSSVPGDVLVARMDAKFQDGQNVGEGFNYATWRSTWGGAKLGHIYLEQHVLNADEVGLVCDSLSLLYISGEDSFYYEINTVTQPVNEKFLFHFTDTDLNIAFMPDDVLFITAYYRSCANPSETQTLIINNSMYLSSVLLSGNSPFATNPSVTGTAAGVTDTSVVHPDSSSLWWCEAHGGIHRVFPVKKEYKEYWAHPLESPGSCGRGGHLSIRQRIVDGERENVFPFEYRSVPGIDFDGPYGPLFENGVPLQFYVDEPAGYYSLTPGGTSTKIQHGFSGDLLQTNADIDLVNPNSPGLYSINPSRTFYSPPFTTPQFLPHPDLNNFSLSSANSTITSNGDTVLLLGDEDFNQTFNFSFYTICIGGGEYPYPTDSAYVVAPEAFSNPCFSGSPGSAVVDRDTSYTVYPTWLFPVVDSDFPPEFHGNTIRHLWSLRSGGSPFHYFYLDKDRELPEGVSIVIRKINVTSFFEAGDTIFPEPVGGGRFSRYSLNQDGRFYVDFVLDDCASASALNDTIYNMQLIYVYSCNSVDTAFQPLNPDGSLVQASRCSNSGHFPRKIDFKLKIPGALLSQVNNSDTLLYQCNTPLEVSTCLNSSLIGGVGNVKATIELPDELSLMQDSGHPMTIRLGNQTPVQVTATETAYNQWLINATPQTSFSSSSPVGSNGWTFGEGNLCFKFYVLPECGITEELDKIDISVKSVRYCNLADSNAIDSVDYSIPIASDPNSPVPCSPEVEIELSVCAEESFASITEGAAPYNISWSTGADSATISVAHDSAYSVTVEDANGCADTASIEVSLICDDSSHCTVDSCGSNGECTFTLIVCNDGDACTSDGCDSLTGCTTIPVVCNDGNACTTDGCDSLTGCTTTPVVCNDGNACTTDGCDSLTGCTATSIVCNDGDACTSDGCDSLTGCTTTPVVCNDGSVCTTDGCDSLAGCTATPIVCNDGNACTTDGCNSITGCTTTPIICDDEDACTTDGCDSLTGCSTTPVLCDDDDGCTDNNCIPATGCTFSPTVCDDTNPCTENGCENDNCVYPSVQADGDFDITHVSCYGACNGAFSITYIRGGTLPIQFYVYYPGGSDSVLGIFDDSTNIFALPPLPGDSGLCAGSYAFSPFIDSFGCELIPGGSFQITQPASLLTASMSNVHTNSCHGNADGTIRAAAAGGTPPYIYQWSNAATDTIHGHSEIYNLVAGTYCVTVSDFKCPDVSDCINLVDPTQLEASLSGTHNYCDDNGSAFLTSVSGGTPPYAYAWYGPGVGSPDSLTCHQDSLREDEITDTITGLAGGYNFSPPSQLHNGYYSVIVTDDHGCTTSRCIGIMDNEPDCNDNDVCTTDACTLVGGCTHTAILCDDGNACTTDACNPASGCTYTEINCNDNNACTTDACNATEVGCIFTPIICDDSDACTSDSCVNGNCVYTPSPIYFTLNTTHVACNTNNTGSIEINPVWGGTPPYSFNWSNQATTQSIINLDPGTYWVTVTDAVGCETSDDITLYETSLNVTWNITHACAGNTGAIDLLSIGGGMPPYSYLWSNAATTQDISNLVQGTYHVTINDSNDCTVTRDFIVNDSCCPQLLYFCDDVNNQSNGMLFRKATNIHASDAAGINCIPPDASVSNDGIVLLQAENEVILEDGFWGHPGNGGLFHAYIAPCSSSIPKTEDSELTSEETNSSAQFMVYPNPFNNSVIIEYHISEPGNIILYIMDVTGKQVTRLLNNVHHDEGSYKLELKTSALAGGVYFCTLKRGDFSETKKIIKISW